MRFRLLLLFFSLCAVQGFGQFNLRDGRVYKEMQVTAMRNILGPYIYGGYTDSLVFRSLSPDSFTIKTYISHLRRSYPDSTIELKTDSTNGDVLFKRRSFSGQVIGMSVLYHFPDHNNWFNFFTPWTNEDSLMGRVVRRFTIQSGNRQYEAFEVKIGANFKRYRDTNTVNGLRVRDIWVKGVGSISNHGGFLHLYTFEGLTGSQDSSRTRTLCVSNPIDPTDFNWINPIYNTCSFNGSLSLKRDLKVTTATSQPNPTANRFSIAGAEKEGVLSLINASGQVVRQENFVPGTEVDISGLPKGLYLFRLQSEGSVMQGKVVRE